MSADDRSPRPHPRANLEQLRKQAKRLLRDAEHGDPHALARLRPGGASSRAAAPTLAEAQAAVARENGFAAWPGLVAALADSRATGDDTATAMHAPSASTTGAATSGAADTMQSAAAPGLALGRIDQIWLDCTDLAEATRFYRDVLGLPRIAEVPGMMAFFQAGEVRLLLGLCRGSPRPNSILYFAVPGVAGALQAAFERLKALGVRLGDPPHCIARGWNGVDAWLAFFEDPFGNQLALKSDVPSAR